MSCRLSPAAALSASVAIDGMGTPGRSKAFHDAAYKNLKDAGFPDRIAWMKAAASERAWMDLGRVGIYGVSAGGQNALGALLFHGDFYKAAVADCGTVLNARSLAAREEGARIIEAWNKIDRLDGEAAARLRAEAARREDVVLISALTGEGVQGLLEAAARRLRSGTTAREILVPSADGEAIAWLHAHGEVLGQSGDGLETRLDVRLTDAAWARFRARRSDRA